MAQNNKNRLKKDQDGNIILHEPITKKISVIIMLILSAGMLLGSLWLMIHGNFTIINILRIVFGLLIGIFAVWSLKK